VKWDGSRLRLSIEIVACVMLLGAGCATSNTRGPSANATCNAQTSCDAAASRDRSAYQNEAEQERARNAFMTIVITSPPH
jgi:hypothetical protein